MRRALALAALAMLGSACGSVSGDVTERLWVSALPGSPRAAFTAFATVRVRGEDHAGSFYHGTLLRGQHDVFRWRTLDKRRAELTFLQDGTRRMLEFAPCSPSAGFDVCMDVKGGPWGVARYESRDRWKLGRRRGGSAEVEMAGLLEEIAAETDPSARD